MFRRALLLVVLAGAAAAGPTLKKLLDPLNPDFPLNPYAWDTWDTLDKDAKFRGKGSDLSEWLDPPPKTKEEIEDDKKKAEERKKKDAELTDAQKERRKEQREQRKKEARSKIYPGFKFDQRLEMKRQAFEELLQPASASKLEGLVKQLKNLDKAMAKFNKTLDAAEEEYVQVKEQLDKIMENKSENYKKKHGKYPDSVMVPRSLSNTVTKRAKELQRLLAVQQSEGQFHEWILKRLAELVAELSDDERKKPVAALAKGIADKNWLYRVRCARLLGHLKDSASRAAFAAALEKEKDPLVLAELIRILGERGDDAEVLKILAKRLDDPSWPVRSAVVRALAGIRTKESVDLLVRRMEKEDGRVLDDIADALRRLTLKDFMPQPEPWKVWWNKVKQEWKAPPEPKPGATLLGEQKGKAVYFYGIQSQSKRVVFCIDISGSMNFPLDGKDGKKPARIIRAKKELNQALTALSQDSMFNIVVYSVGVKPWKRRMQAANLKNKKAARKFVDGLEPNGGTNIFDALLESLDLAAGVGKKKKKAKPGADPVADTIFFLTDGQPSAGRITDAKQILEEITKRNELLGVKIHTVGVSREQNAGFLLNLAKRNHGQYVAAK
jgi:hypothetical protein